MIRVVQTNEMTYISSILMLEAPLAAGQSGSGARCD